MSPVIGRQRGATLLIALVMLLLLSLLAASSMRQTLLQARSGGAALENTQAFNAAEAALREGERRLVALSQQPSFTAFSAGFATCPESVPAVRSAFAKAPTGDLCILTKASDLNTGALTQTWAAAALQASGTDPTTRTVAYRGSDGSASFAQTPRWVVTAIGSSSVDVAAPATNLFRITAVAQDRGKRFPVILQSVVALEVP